LPREEGARLLHQRGVGLKRYFAGAGRGAALDLEEQARAGAALIEGIGAGAQEERPLQRVDRARDRASRGERAEIGALARARAAMLGDLRSRMVAGNEDVRKGLVVAQKHIVARA